MLCLMHTEPARWPEKFFLRHQTTAHNDCGGSGEFLVPSCRSPSLLAGAASQRLCFGSDDCARIKPDAL